MDDHDYVDSDNWGCEDYLMFDPGCGRWPCSVNDGAGEWGQCLACPVACRVAKPCCQDDTNYEDLDGWDCTDYNREDPGCATYSCEGPFSNAFGGPFLSAFWPARP